MALDQGLLQFGDNGVHRQQVNQSTIQLWQLQDAVAGKGYCPFSILTKAAAQVRTKFQLLSYKSDSQIETHPSRPDQRQGASSEGPKCSDKSCRCSRVQSTTEIARVSRITLVFTESPPVNIDFKSRGAGDFGATRCYLAFCFGLNGLSASQCL